MNSNEEEAKKLQKEISNEYRKKGIEIKGVSITLEGNGMSYDSTHDKEKEREKRSGK